MPHAARLATLACAALLATPAFADPILKDPVAVDPKIYKVETIATGLDHPWSLAFLPDTSVLVTERNNGLRIIRDGKLDPVPYAGLPAAFKEGQGGYFDIALDPDIIHNARIFISFAEGTTDANHTALLRATLGDHRLEDVQVIFRNTPDKNTDAHFAARVVFLPDETLLIGTGDGFEFREQAQNKASGLGKIMRLTVDGKIPPDNPFVGEAGTRAEIYSLGHRNQQGMAIDSETGAVWQTEHGALSGDEVNRIEKGGNYGWPLATFSVDYSGAVISPYTEKEGTIQPMAVWKPERFAPSGLAVYRGAMFKDWDGALLAGSLAEKCVDVIKFDANGAVTLHQRLTFPDINQRIRDVRVASDGAIWLLTDEDEGKVLRITPAK